MDLCAMENKHTTNIVRNIASTRDIAHMTKSPRLLRITPFKYSCSVWADLLTNKVL